MLPIVSPFSGSRTASSERASSFRVGTPIRGSTRRSVGASSPVSFSGAASSRESLIPPSRLGFCGRMEAQRSPLSVMLPTSCRARASFPRLRPPLVSFHWGRLAIPQPTRRGIITAWSFTPSTGRSCRSPSMRRTRAFLMTAADFLQDQWSWIVRCSCAASSTSGAVGLIFIFRPRLLISLRAVSHPQQTCPGHWKK